MTEQPPRIRLNTLRLVLTAVCLSATLAACISPSSQVIESADGIISIEPFDTSIIEPIEISPIHPLSEADQEVQNTPQDLWQRIRDGFQMDLQADNARIKAQRDWYIKHQAYLDRVATRAQPYLYHIVEQIEQQGLPMELALLPIVESAFDPFAYSHGRASGLWQFIPSTGKNYGLKQNWWYDGRRDVVSATDAALKYLSRAEKSFNGNWNHAIASYNAGGGNVRKGIRYNKKRKRPTDFWSLRLPKETQAYVPKLIAIAQIVANPEKYGISLLPIPDEPAFEIINLPSQIDLAQVAGMSGLSLEDVYTYNPGFSRWATDPDGPHRLLIPVTHAEKFKTALAETPTENWVNWHRYKIKNGDSLIKIAKQFHTHVDLLKDVNRIRGNTIRAGDKILIPKSSQGLSSYTLSEGRRLATKKAIPRGQQKSTHTVQSGESFWTISRRYGVNLRSLAKWNGMAPTDTLQVGQQLVIWTNHSVIGSAANNPQMIRKVNYRVRKGDSLAKIAGKFNTTVSKLSSWNSLDKKKYLQPGQKLKLYVDVREINP